MVSGADPDTGSLYKVEMSDYMASDEEDSSDDGRRSGDLPKLASQYVSKPALSRRSASYQRPDKKTTIHMLDGSQVSFSPKDGDQISIEADELSRSSTLIPENIQNNEDREDYVFTQRQRLEALISAFDREQDKIRSQRDGGSRYYEAQSNGEPRVTQTKSDKSKNQTKYHENHRPTTRNPVSEHQRENQYWNPRQQQNRIEAPTRFKGATKPNMPQNQTQVQPVKKKAAIHRPSEHPQEAQYDTGQRKTLVNTSRRNRRPTSYHGTAPNGPTLQREPTIQIYPQYSVYDPSNGIVGTVIGFCQACLMHQRAIPSEQCSLHHGYGMDLYSMPPHPPSSFERPPTSRALSAPYPGAISMVEDDYHRLMPPPREMRKNSVSPPPYYYSVPPPRRARRNSVSPPLPTPPIEVMPNGNPGPTPIGLNMPPPLPPPNRFDYSQQPRRIDSSRPTSTLDDKLRGPHTWPRPWPRPNTYRFTRVNRSRAKVPTKQIFARSMP
ncbi:hypothetical protein BCR34DRAFT_76334 [Clohesyomyces aquaticus]|uniref:Uncharacterized protein n=1 Tax=Clohesyomyces aquaticus TaxID=1231657 RepID=A0A1Y1YYN4_9PLEO|nr:hypothetical protein BCR34DRAFT_76334 [Clohesyomyces aquaticus]